MMIMLYQHKKLTYITFLPCSIIVDLPYNKNSLNNNLFEYF
jgi:hypothetical protein